MFKNIKYICLRKMDRNASIKTEREKSEDKNVKSVSDSYEPRKRGLTSIIESLKKHHRLGKFSTCSP